MLGKPCFGRHRAAFSKKLFLTSNRLALSLRGSREIHHRMNRR
jgi:hypothetical protein